MIRKYLSSLLIIFLVVFSSSLPAQDNELLTTKDIHRIMDEILEQHVNKDEISTEILKNSFQIYVDQFDPDRTYLLESEVQPFLKMDNSSAKQTLNQYKRSNFSKYETLNTVIQKSISRAREIRSALLRDKAAILEKNGADIPATPFSEEQKRPFATTKEELQSRIQNQISQIIYMQRQRYGNKAIQQNQEKTFHALERQMRHRENQYFYEDENGRQLPPQEKGNLFTMHLLKALSRSLDSHTSYLDDQETQDMKIRLEKGFRGIGVILQKTPLGVIISKIMKDSPAERSGRIEINDRIIKINEINVEEDSLEELVDKLRDDTKDTILLILARKEKSREKTLTVTLKRELIAVNEGRVDSEIEPFDNGIIGKIILHSFYQGAKGVTSEKDMRKAIKDIEAKGTLKGLIIDLRENSGGFLNQAVKVAGLFITNGVVVVSKYSNGEQRYYRDMDGKVSFDGPIIVLTSRATASAAEIVAQALQDYGVAIVVGDKQTYGKGTIQSQTVTNGNSTSHFKVTVGKYYTVSGKTPQVQGVPADIVVPSLYSKELIGEEYLEHALAPDTIEPAYRDGLVDVDSGLRPWYLRYYMPTLQKKETEWKEILPELKRNSAKRFAENRDYQNFLEGNIDWSQYQSGEKAPGEPDYQMEEATRILKDMILLERKMYESKIVGS